MAELVEAPASLLAEVIILYDGSVVPTTTIIQVLKVNKVVSMSSTNDLPEEQADQSEHQEPGRKPFADRPNAFNLLAWLMDGATGIVEELRHNDLGLSQEFWKHSQAARRETLLALRAAIDDLIAKGERSQQEETDRQKRRERRGGIDINF